MSARNLPLFSVTVRDDIDKRIAVLRGDFDIAQVERFERELAGGDDCSVLVVDLESVTLIDSAALGAMLRLRKRRSEQGRVTEFHAPHRYQRRVFEVTGLTHLLSSGEGLARGPHHEVDE